MLGGEDESLISRPPADLFAKFPVKSNLIEQVKANAKAAAAAAKKKDEKVGLHVSADGKKRKVSST